MELKKFIATTIREYLNENVNFLIDKIRHTYNKEKIKGTSELEYSKLIKFGRSSPLSGRFLYFSIDISHH